MTYNDDPLARYIDSAKVQPAKANRVSRAPIQNLTARFSEASRLTDAEIAAVLGISRQAAGAWRVTPNRESFTLAQLRAIGMLCEGQIADLKIILDEIKSVT